MLEQLKEQVFQANLLLPKHGLDHIYLGECIGHRQGAGACGHKTFGRFL